MTVERVTSITAISLSVPAFGPASCGRESVRRTVLSSSGQRETGSHRRQCHAHDFGTYRQVLDLGSAAENATCKVAAESLRIRERRKAEDPDLRGARVSILSCEATLCEFVVDLREVLELDINWIQGCRNDLDEDLMRLQIGRLSGRAYPEVSEDGRTAFSLPLTFGGVC